MFRVNRLCGALVLAMLLAAAASAQTARLEGTVLDLSSKPFPDVTVTIKAQTGQTYTTKTDANGKFVQTGMRAGIYTITYTKDATDTNPSINYSTEIQITEGAVNTTKIDFQQVALKLNPNAAAEMKARAEAEAKFQGLKQHFEAGVAALNDADVQRKQMATASADQKQGFQDKINTDCTTALNEFTQANSAANPKDVNNQAAIAGNIAIADECLAKYQDAADTFQKAIELKPQPAYYSNMATDLAKVGKLDDAGAACDKAVAANPALGGGCWKNIGIVLSNAGKMKEATDPLKKATDADPKDAQAWFLLGGALAGQIDTKQEGDKLLYVIPPGTTDAYQKCIDIDPNGPYAAQAKAALDGLNQLSGGQSTTVGDAKAKKKKS